MRIAVLSDVHGNLGALEAVLSDIAGRSVDVTVNLGDLLSGGLQPRETGDRLLALDLPTVRGNHERQVLTVPPERMSASDRLAHDSITDVHRAWLASLPLTLEVADGVLWLLCSPPWQRTTNGLRTYPDWPPAPGYWRRDDGWYLG